MPPRERSGCRGPALKGGPTDTEGHTWGGQGSHWGSEGHQASPLLVVVCAHCCPGPAEILPNKTPKLKDLIPEKSESSKVSHSKAQNYAKQNQRCKKKCHVDASLYILLSIIRTPLKMSPFL